MKQPNILLKVTVVASSLLLASGLVLYRSGAFDGMIQSDALTQTTFASGTMTTPPDTPGTKTPVDTGSATRSRELSKDTAREEQPFFYGSKSPTGVIPYQAFDTAKDAASDTPGAQPDTVRRRDRFMGGSKSLAPLIESSTPDSQTTPTPESSRRPKNNP